LPQHLPGQLINQSINPWSASPLIDDSLESKVSPKIIILSSIIPYPPTTYLPQPPLLPASICQPSTTSSVLDFQQDYDDDDDNDEKPLENHQGTPSRSPKNTSSQPKSPIIPATTGPAAIPVPTKHLLHHPYQKPPPSPSPSASHQHSSRQDIRKKTSHHFFRNFT
jgi:hypothetical protein